MVIIGAENIVLRIFVGIGFILFFVVVVEDILAHFEFEGALAVIVHDEAKGDSNDSEQTTNVGKHVVQFSELTLNFQSDI